MGSFRCIGALLSICLFGIAILNYVTLSATPGASNEEQVIYYFDIIYTFFLDLSYLFGWLWLLGKSMQHVKLIQMLDWIHLILLCAITAFAAVIFTTNCFFNNCYPQTLALFVVIAHLCVLAVYATVKILMRCFCPAFEDAISALDHVGEQVVESVVDRSQAAEKESPESSTKSHDEVDLPGIPV